MSVSIDWFAFVQVFVAALLAASLVVTFYAIGVRLLVRGGKAPVVAPVEFPDALTVVSDRDRRRSAKAAAKAAKRSPLTGFQKRVALVGAYASFTVCALAVLGGLLMIVFNH